MAAKMVLLLVLCILFPAFIVATRPMTNPFTVVGKIYCDTCRVGFETSASTYIPGAKVRVECRHRNTQEVLYSVEGITDRTGTYRMTVKEDQEDKLCDAVLVSSPLEGCGSADPGRDRSRVILTRYNGMTSDVRFANALGFLKDQPMSECDMVLQQYQELED